MKREIKPLPYPVYFWPVVFLAVLGLLDSVYLSLSHYRVYVDIGYKSFCAISKSINCDTVSQSPYSIFLGIPVPVWGIYGYTFFLLFLPFAYHKKAEKKRIWPVLFVTALFFSLYSVALALISTFYIHSYCIMCIATYAINLFLLFYAWIIRRRFDKQGLIAALKGDTKFISTHWKKFAAVFAPLFLTAGVVIMVFPEYWHLSPPVSARELPMGVTEEGHPWIGSENPELTIVEFTDYQCFQCRKMHYFLRQILFRKSDKLRIVHRHFPMDQRFNPIVKEPYHHGAGYMALLSMYAQDRGKFWEMNDLLFDLAAKREDLEISFIARKTGLPLSGLNGSLVNPDLRRRLHKDIKDAIEYGIVGTPGFVINGEVHLAEIPNEILTEIID